MMTQNTPEETPAMLHPIRYLSFNGNCTEAMRFYERAPEAHWK